MAEAPERIWAGLRDDVRYWTPEPTATSFREYVRAEIIASLQKELAEARAERDDARIAESFEAKRGNDAESRVTALSAEVERLRGALEPFAADYDNRSRLAPGPDIDHWPIGGSSLTYGHLRRARAALTNEETAR